MKYIFKAVSNFLQSYKLQFLAVCVFGLVFLKLTHPTGDGIVYFLFNELMILSVLYFAAINGTAFLEKQKMPPLSIVVLIGVSGLISNILLENGTIFFSFVSSWLGTKTSFSQPVLLLYDFLIVIPFLTIFVALRHLFFLKQKKNLHTYYNLLVIYVVASSLTAFLKLQYESLSWIYYAILTVTYILVVMNSARISWIAFLPKKMKFRLLLMSVGAIIVFAFTIKGININHVEEILKQTSPGLYNFFEIISIYSLIYFAFLFFTTLFHLPTAELIDRKTREVSSLQNLSRLINQVFDPRELMETITELAQQMSTADASWIFLKDKGTYRIEAPKNIDIYDAEQISKNILSTIQKEFSGVIFIDTSNNTKKEKSGSECCYAAVAAIKSHAITSGLLISIRRSKVPFDDEDRNTLEAFADSVAIAFENSRLVRESIEKERMERELDVAREMQRKLIPEKIPAYLNLKISASFIPAFEVGGDYYDFFELENNKLGFVIADVSGKGISAAFIMAEIRGIFEILSRTKASPKELLINVNTSLKRSLSRKYFITAIYGVIDILTGKVVFARAGHTPGLLLRNNVFSKITPKGIGLGLTYTSLFKETLEEHEVQLEHGDTLLFYTDGITESKNEFDEDYGILRLEELLKMHSEEEPGIMQNKILENLSVFSKNSQQHDDITAIIFKWDKTTMEISNG